jgi:HAD superfamily hydrolase (TIGR01509 family)
MSRQSLPAPGTLAIRAVAFDMDGLLIDSERLDRDLWQSVARQRGLDLPDAVHASLIGLREPDSHRRLAEHFGADADLEAMRVEVGERWEHHALHGGITIKTGVERTLRLLEAHRIPKALATSSSRLKAQASLGSMFRRMDVVVCGEDVAAGKPAPDIFLRAAEVLGVPPSCCLALEDSMNGLRSAQAAGMIAIMVPDLSSPPSDARYVSPSLDAVADWLERELAAGGGRGA